MKKTRLSLLWFYLLASLTTDAQIAYQNKVDPKTYLPFKISLSNANNRTEDSLFFLKLYDHRDDTSRIGFFNGDGYTYYAFQFKEPAMPYLSKKLNENHKAVLDTLHVVFKKIWIYETQLPVKSNYRDNGIAGRIEASLYFKRGDSFYLFFQYDSTILSKGYIGSRADEILSKSFLHFQHTAYTVARNIGNFSGFQRFNEIPSHKVNYPILQTNSYNDGIYRTLDDFLNNKPDDINFNYVVKKKKEQILLLESKGSDSILSHGAWGFCKKGIPYMRIENTYSKLTRIEHSFELRATDLARYYQSVRYDPSTSIISAALFPSYLAGGLTTLLIVPNKKFEAFSNTSSFKLDLATGKIY